MEHLQHEIERLLKTLANEAEIRTRLESLVSVYPFEAKSNDLANRIRAAYQRQVSGKLE